MEEEMRIATAASCEEIHREVEGMQRNHKEIYQHSDESIDYAGSDASSFGKLHNGLRAVTR